MEIKTEIEKLARIQKEMERNDDCDIFIKKRDGVIVNAVVKPTPPEVRVDFCVLFHENLTELK